LALLPSRVNAKHVRGNTSISSKLRAAHHRAGAFQTLEMGWLFFPRFGRLRLELFQGLEKRRVQEKL
ncbi:MAG: hypothetical protein NTY53_25600, partial [Kiritimatiellaeota bacterium]|nr:hypothetical protein [Kiritimatiellota bacterium]